MSQAAAVVDLETYRRERRERAERPRSGAEHRPVVASPPWIPVYVAWVPVWPVA